MEQISTPHKNPSSEQIAQDVNNVESVPQQKQTSYEAEYTDFEFEFVGNDDEDTDSKEYVYDSQKESKTKRKIRKFERSYSENGKYFLDDVRNKKLPKVLSKFCLGPGSAENNLEIENSKTRDDLYLNNLPKLKNVYAKEQKISNENPTTIIKNMLKNKLSENLATESFSSFDDKSKNENTNDTNISKIDKVKIDLENDNKNEIMSNQEDVSENDKKNQDKFSLTRTPSMLRKMFISKSDDTKNIQITVECKNLHTGSGLVGNECDDIDDEVELRKKPKGIKSSLRESFRNSFRAKRTLSEPSPKENHVKIKPRRPQTFKIFSKAILSMPVTKMLPPTPLLVEDPPSSDDVSDLEDVKHFTDPAFLNGSSGNFGSAGTRSVPTTPQGVLSSSPGGLTEPLSQPCSPGCTSPSIQRSPSHSVFSKCEKASLKHLSTSTPAMTAQAQLTEPPSPKATKDPKVRTTSKARQKKFLRHFPNVEDDEKVLNHYSCALIGDILLQGHLYITKNYFAFYSNVFGYVTKLLIPVLTVENITKEKTARIIPNAVGISTNEDKHVFGSLMSRDNTLQYMRTVWQKAKSASPVIIEPEIIEPDLDSSESGESGRDSPPLTIKPRFSLVKKIEKESLPTQSEGHIFERKGSRGLVKTLKEAISEFKKLPRQSLILFATTLLLILLFLSAAVLLYRISKIQNRYSLVLQDSMGVSGSEDVYSDLLQWQTHLHSKSAGAVHSFLDSNLDQIAKVRQSLEALSSLLIQSSPLAAAQDVNAKPPLEPTKDAS